MSNQLHPNTFKFLKQLKSNNNKQWFVEHRGEYEEVRKVFVEFIQTLIDEMAKSDKTLIGQQAKNAVFRINRDVRFSKDKTPYKTNFSAVISSGGKKFDGAGFYLSVEPGNKNYLGGGIWQPEAKPLAAIRQEIDYNFKEFQKIVESKNFKNTLPQFYQDSLKTMPKGYEASNPAAEYLRCKSFVFGTNLNDAEANDKSYFKSVIQLHKTILPFFNFLNRAVS